MRQRDGQCPEHGDQCPYLEPDEDVIKRQNQQAIERMRWGGPSPWAGKDSRMPAQKRER